MTSMSQLGVPLSMIASPGEKISPGTNRPADAGWPREVAKNDIRLPSGFDRQAHSRDRDDFQVNRMQSFERSGGRANFGGSGSFGGGGGSFCGGPTSLDI